MKGEGKNDGYGNKGDLYENEEVEEGKAKDWANEIGAIHKTTSAKVGFGIKELFNSIAEALLQQKNKKENKNLRIESVCFFKDQKKTNKCCLSKNND